MRLTRVSAIAFAAALGLSAAARAQTPPPPPPSPGAGHGWDGAAMRQHTEAREAARLKALHDVLAIRPDQESAFQAFAARPTRPQNGGPGWRGPDDRRMAGGTAGAGPEPTTAPERIDAALRRFDERTSRMRDALQQRAATVKSFYAVLSPDQRRTLDALPQLTGHGGWGGRGDAGPRGPGGGMGQGRPGEGE